jgi:hypothetical protein
MKYLMNGMLTMCFVKIVRWYLLSSSAYRISRVTVGHALEISIGVIKRLGIESSLFLLIIVLLNAPNHCINHKPSRIIALIASSLSVAIAWWMGSIAKTLI